MRAPLHSDATTTLGTLRSHFGASIDAIGDVCRQSADDRLISIEAFQFYL